MRRALYRGTIVLTVLLAGIWVIRRISPPLPRIKLAGGGEVRVYKICYGGPDDHQLARSPKVILSAWSHLPTSFQAFFPKPNFGDSGESPMPGHTAVSVYFGWLDRNAKLPEASPTERVIMTTDSGEKSDLGWAFPFDASDGGSYRQILIMDPPKDSIRLHFALSVEDEKVGFTIANPAYGK